MPKTTEARIEEVLESIRPALWADGGDLEFLGFDEVDGVVELRLLGVCETCPISMTLKEGIERRLKSSVPGVTEVRVQASEAARESSGYIRGPDASSRRAGPRASQIWP